MKWDAFRRKAIDPAVAEVNQLSGFLVSYTPIKSGRSFVGITLHWKLAPASDRANAQRELEASRVGRAIRRAGKSENVVDLLPVINADVSAFPRVGGISYSSWAEAAKGALPHPQPDLDDVADRFRDFAARKGILLNHPKIAETFLGFCKNWKADE
jgi:hypothetical protein